MKASQPQSPHRFSAAFVALAVTFSVCLVTSNLFVPRLCQVGSTWLQLSGAVLIFPLSYIINDLLTEVYGYRKTMYVIWLGFAMSAFTSLAAQGMTLLPRPQDPENLALAQSFDSLFRFMPRTTLASLLAFVAGSHMNAWLMSRLKILTRGKGFGLRAILSSLCGELSDTLLFYPLVFLGVMPIGTILSLIFTEVAIKTLYEVLVLPLTAHLSRRLKAKEQLDTYDYNIQYNPFKI